MLSNLALMLIDMISCNKDFGSLKRRVYASAFCKTIVEQIVYEHVYLDLDLFFKVCIIIALVCYIDSCFSLTCVSFPLEVEFEFGGGLNSSWGDELKLYVDRTGSTLT